MALTDQLPEFLSFEEFLKQKTEFEADAWNRAYDDAMDRGDADPLPHAEQAARIARAEWDARHPLPRVTL